MESNQQALAQIPGEMRQISGSNVFTKTVNSRLYETLNVETSSMHHNRMYDPQYRSGFPKLYSFETSGQNRSRVSLDERGKYSFRNDYSKIVEQNTLLIRQNTFLREEITRLTNLVEVERRNAGGRIQIDRLNAILIQRDNQIRILKERIFVLESQGSKTNEWQLRFNESQNIIAQLNSRINILTQQSSQSQNIIAQLNSRINILTQQSSQYQSQNIIAQLNSRINILTQQSSQYQSQINQLNFRLNQYQTQISQLNVQINQYTTRITQLERQQKSAVPIIDPQVEVLKNQISTLKQVIQQYETQISTLTQKNQKYETKIFQYEQTFSQYESQISQYEKTIYQYESQITTLQQANWKLEQNIEKERTNVKPQAPVVVENQKWLIEGGKLNFRVIILLEEINRLKQKEQELMVKAEQLHAYLLKAENYIEEIQLELEKNNLKEHIPTYIVEKVTHLEEQNTKYTLLIEELQSRLSITQVNGVSQDEHFAKLGYRDFRIIILLEEINRLNNKLIETRKYLQNAESYIEEIQTTIEQRQTVIPVEVESQLSYLSQENHRLNLLIQNYIDEIKHLRVNTTTTTTHTKIQYQVPPEIQNKVVFLAHENQRLTALVNELQNRPQVQAQPVKVVEYQTSPEVQNKLALLSHENERLTVLVTELQNRAQVQAPPAKVEYRTAPEVQNRLTFLIQENERLSNYIIELENRPITVVQPVSEELEEDYAKAKFRIIILLEEINRLNNQVKLVESYLINAENHIEQLEIRLHEQSTINLASSQPTVQYVVPEQITQQLAKFSMQVIVLLEEINRLNHANKETNSHLINAENYIEQCELRINEFILRQTQNVQVRPQIQSVPVYQPTIQYVVPEQITQQLAKFSMQVIVLLEEINRLNHVNKETNSHLINAENYIEQCEIRINELTNTLSQNSQLQVAQPAVQYVVPEQITEQLAKFSMQVIVLLEEINRLNHVNKQINSHLINAENYIEQSEIRINELIQSSAQNIQFQVPPEIENRLAFLAQQNQRLILTINDLQTRPARVETRIEQKVEFKIPPELERKIAVLTTENDRLQREIIKISGQKGEDLTFELAKAQFRSIILLEEINRLNYLAADLRQNLINAQDYIYQFENRPLAVPAEVENEIIALRTENQKLHAEINRISLEYEQRIANYKTEISNINIQLSTFRSQSTTYKSKFEELQRKSLISSGSAQVEQQLRVKLATENFRVMILLQEINRLNHKLNLVDTERLEVIGHLVNAENYIVDLEGRLSQLESSKQQTVTTNTVVSGSNSAIQQLNAQLVELQYKSKIQIAQRDLRIIFLLQQINRLNYKLNLSGGSSSVEISALQQAKQQTERELHEVLNHLRQAEEYIGQILRDNEGLTIERDHLINELNRFTRTN